jgi:methyl-accepting chemotaxis protein
MKILGLELKGGSSNKEDHEKNEEDNCKNQLGGVTKYINKVATIRVKLIVAFFVPILFIVLLGVASFQKAATGIRSSYEHSTKQTLNMTSNYVTLGTDNMKAISAQFINDDITGKYFTGMYKNDVKGNITSQKTIKDSIIAKIQTDKFISDIYILSDEVDSITSADQKVEAMNAGFYDTETGKIIKKSMKATWYGSNEYLDEKLGTPSNEYSMRLIQGFSGVDTLVVIDMDYDAIMDILNSMELDSSGVIGFITLDGKEIISGDNGEQQGNIFTGEGFFKDAQLTAETNGALYVDYHGEENLFLYSKVGETGAIICALIPKRTILSQADSIMYLTVIIVIVACLIAVAIGFFISTGIDKTIKSIIKKLKMAASGDITVDFTTKRKDEFRVLMDEINNTFTNMKVLIKQVIVLSAQVSDTSNNVTDASEELVKSTGEISIAMNEIEQGVMQQAKDAEECLAQMDNLSNKIVTMSNSTDKISEIAETAKNCIGSGTEVTKNLNQQTKSTIEITMDIVKGIEELNEQSKSIGSIINVINDISSQTNLLSLNASIEAARAGEYGRGFAVVASEIRSLAELTHLQVNDIKRIVENIQSNTKEVVKTAKKAEEVMVLQDTAVKNTTDSYLQINESVDYLMIHLNDIKVNVSNIDGARVSTLGAIENISAVLEEIAASTNNVNQTSNNQLGAVEILNQSARYLKDNSGELVDAIQKFQV